MGDCVTTIHLHIKQEDFCTLAIIEVTYKFVTIFPIRSSDTCGILDCPLCTNLLCQVLLLKYAFIVIVIIIQNTCTLLIINSLLGHGDGKSPCEIEANMEMQRCVLMKWFNFLDKERS